MSKSKNQRSRSEKKPSVRIVRPSGRPFQLRYTCPVEKREIRISTGGRDEDEAELLKRELEAKLLLGIETNPVKRSRQVRKWTGRISGNSIGRFT